MFLLKILIYPEGPGSCQSPSLLSDTFTPLQFEKHLLASGPWHMLFPLPGTLSSSPSLPSQDEFLFGLHLSVYMCFLRGAIPSTPTPLLTLGRAGVTGAKAICIRSCPKQSLTAVEASSSQREGQGRGPRPARSSAGASVESGVSAKENDGEGFTFLWRLHCPHALPSAPSRACSDLAGIARHRSTRVAPTSHHQPPRWQLPQKRGFPKEGLRAGFWLERGQEAYPRLYLDSFSLERLEKEERRLGDKGRLTRFRSLPKSPTPAPHT